MKWKIKTKLVFGIVIGFCIGGIFWGEINAETKLPEKKIDLENSNFEMQTMSYLEPEISNEIAHWTFDNINENKYLYDLSGNENLGYGENFTTSTMWRTGVDGEAVYFDGEDDFFQMGSPADLYITGSTTINAWIYTQPPHQNQWGGIYSNYSGSGERILVNDNGSLLAQYSIGGNGYNITTDAGTIPDETWTFINFIYDGNEAVFWINGVKQMPVSASGEIGEYGGRKQIGWGDNTPGYYSFHGKIDEVSVYNKALSEEEILELYNKNKNTTSTNDMNTTDSNAIVIILVVIMTFIIIDFIRRFFAKEIK